MSIDTKLGSAILSSPFVAPVYDFVTQGVIPGVCFGSMAMLAGSSVFDFASMLRLGPGPASKDMVLVGVVTSSAYFTAEFYRHFLETKARHYSGSDFCVPPEQTHRYTNNQLIAHQLISPAQLSPAIVCEADEPSSVRPAYVHKFAQKSRD